MIAQLLVLMIGKHSLQNCSIKFFPLNIKYTLYIYNFQSGLRELLYLALMGLSPVINEAAVCITQYDVILFFKA